MEEEGGEGRRGMVSTLESSTMRWVPSSPSSSFCGDGIGRSVDLFFIVVVGRGSKKDADADIFPREAGWKRAFLLPFLLPFFVLAPV